MGTPIDEPAMVDGLLLKFGCPSQDRQQFIFAGGAGWLAAGFVPAGSAGFDVSLFDRFTSPMARHSWLPTASRSFNCWPRSAASNEQR